MKRESKNDQPETTEKPKSKSFVQQLKDKFLGSQAYNLDKNTFSFLSGSYGVVVTVAALIGGLQPYFWHYSYGLAASLGLGTSELAVSAVFLVLNSVFDSIVGIPVGLYSTFVLEEKHGFNKTSMKLFWTDKIKGFLISNIVTVPLMLAVVKLVRWGGEHFYLYVWSLLFVFSLVMLTVYPNFIAPLFNTYEPLEEGELRTEINNLADSLDYPLKKLYLVDGSKRSSHSNAYLYGFWKDKRIVLFDTLIKNEKEPELECTTKEVVGILGHELGHWKMSHTVKGFVLQMLLSFITLKGFGEFVSSPDMYASFGLKSQPVVIGLTLFFYIISPIGAVLGLALNTMTRAFEFQADAFAVKLGKAEELKSGLLKISISNLASFHVDPFYHAFHNSHPTLVERLRTIDEESRKKKVD
mmetsp:Transcript_16928/g.21660  ORF Transcript_16928/g.21660 Transcript_16928/m.21660 type:complete len:412 (+) Transcript_16928:1-1236(+)